MPTAWIKEINRESSRGRWDTELTVVPLQYVAVNPSLYTMLDKKDIDRDRLSKLLGMLGSAHDGEIANAGRAAHAMMKAARSSWPEVLCKVRMFFGVLYLAFCRFW